MKNKLFVTLILSIATLNCFGQQQQTDPWIDYVETEHNPVVTRISAEEIKENATPAAVAYNFVNAILEMDFDKMIEYTPGEYREQLEDEFYLQHSGDKDSFFNQYFSVGKLGILSWKPALEDGYEVAVAYIQDESKYYEDGEWYRSPEMILKNGKIYLPGESEPRKTEITKKIYITCSPSSEVNNVGFQNISRYGDTNVKVLVDYDNGSWKVVGFK